MPLGDRSKDEGRDNHQEGSSAQFIDLLRESIDQGMTGVLGKGGMQAIMFHLQLAEYAKDPKEFHDMLHSILQDGSVSIERMIVKELYRSLNLPYHESGEFNFQQSLDFARGVLTARTKRQVV